MKDTRPRLIIIGASGHGKVVADIALHCGYRKIAFLDDNEALESCMGFTVIGRVSNAENYKDSEFIVAVGNPKIREMIQKKLRKKELILTTLIHPDAVIGENVSFGAGTVVMAGAVINPDSTIGEGCIINTGATVDHDNVLGEFAHISVGAHLAGTVRVGRHTWIGAGAVVSNNVNICGDCMIGAGAVVVKDIDVPGTYIGVPAKKK